MNWLKTSNKRKISPQPWRLGVLAVFFFTILLVPHARSQQPELSDEVRAVWITTVLGLDWPKSFDAAEQRSSLLRTIRTLKQENFNTIFFQVRARGDAYYRSSYEPWAENLTGTPGKDPGYDPLAFLIDQAHRAGLEVHAWFSVYKVDGADREPSVGLPHIAEAQPEWVFRYENELWLNPGIPEVNGYLVKVALEVVGNYAVDGIQFDFVRYPGRNVPDKAQFEQYAGETQFADWRRGNIDMFLAEFHGAANEARPGLKIGATPLGNFRADAEFPEGYSEVYQNAVGWLADGIVDYIVPQIYWDLESTRDDPAFDMVARRWKKSAHGRHVYAGIGAYKANVSSELPLQIDAAREAGLEGQAFFRLGNLTDFSRLGGRYDSAAAVPQMPWKQAAITQPPPVAETENPISPGLTASIDSGNPATINLAYRISHQAAVSIIIHRDPQEGTNPEVVPLTHGVRDAGVYIMAFDRSRFPPGEYLVVLRAGSDVVSRRISLPPL